MLTLIQHNLQHHNCTKHHKYPCTSTRDTRMQSKMALQPDTTHCQSKISLSLFVLVVIGCIGSNLHAFRVLAVEKHIVINGSNAGATQLKIYISNRCSLWPMDYIKSDESAASENVLVANNTNDDGIDKRIQGIKCSTGTEWYE